MLSGHNGPPQGDDGAWNGRELTNREILAPAILVRTLMVTKEHILAEIRRTASANSGRPLGRQSFAKQTGIREPDWRGRYWARWGDALKEAGFAPNALQKKRPDAVILGGYVQIVRKYGRLPTSAEVRLQRFENPDSPNHRLIERLGSKRDLVSKVLAYCKENPGNEDVLRICETGEGIPARTPQPREHKGSEETWGFVYLMKSGRYYKLGRTNSTGRREREFQIQLPERPRLVHQIKTDDPVGIEAYWHKRFDTRRLRKEAEFFDLSPQDVSAFKRRKFM